MKNIKYLMLMFFCFGLSFVRGNAQVIIKSPADVNSVQSLLFDDFSLKVDQFDFNMPTKQSQLNQSAVFKHYPSINHLPGMFCKLEYKMETRSKLAPRFRLGSLVYTEWMEGKQDFYMRYFK